MSLRDDLKAYLDGELPPPRMAEMREAIERDPDLAREANLLRAIGEGIRSAAPQPAPAGLEETLAALNRGARRPWWVLAAPMAVAAAGVAVFMVPLLQGEVSSSNARTDVAQVATASKAATTERFRDEERQAPEVKATVSVPPADKGKDKAAQDKAEGVVATPNVRAQPKTSAKSFRRSPPDTKAATVAEPPKKPSAPPEVSAPVASATAPLSAKAELAKEEGPIVVEVASLEEAEAAVKRIATELRGEVVANAPNLEPDAVTESRATKPGDRKLVLEVEPEQAVEARRRVREALATPRSRDAGSQAGGLPNNAAAQYANQQALGNQGQSNQQAAPGAPSAQGGFGGGAQAAESRGKGTPQAKLRRSSAKRRIEIVLKPKPPVAPNPPGTIQE